MNIMTVALAFCILTACACDAITVSDKTGGDFSIGLEISGLSENSVSCTVTIAGSRKANFAYLSYTNVTSGEGRSLILDDCGNGVHQAELRGLVTGEYYQVTALANVDGVSGEVSSETLLARPDKPVSVSLVSRTEDAITVKLSVNPMLKVLVKGITYKPKSSRDEAEYVLLEDTDTYTITGADPYSVYLVRGFVNYEGASAYSWSSDLDIAAAAQEPSSGGYTLVFSEEFNTDGEDLTKVWTFEEGYKRNNEAQWYSKSKENAYTQGGYLHIVARKNHLGSDGTVHSYTSASLTTQKSFVYCYGRVEVRAKIPTGGGMWPAIWQVGNTWTWPQNGELDIMEYYGEAIKANVACGGTQNYKPTWFSSSTPMSHFEKSNPQWREQFHVWVLEWDYDTLVISLDGEVLNTVSVDNTYNRGYGGNYENPYRYRSGFGHYLWLDLALGGNCGGTIDDSLLPAEYLVDYVRVYQKERLP